MARRGWQPQSSDLARGNVRERNGAFVFERPWKSRRHAKSHYPDRNATGRCRPRQTEVML